MKKRKNRAFWIVLGVLMIWPLTEVWKIRRSRKIESMVSHSLVSTRIHAAALTSLQAQHPAATPDELVSMLPQYYAVHGPMKSGSIDQYRYDIFSNSKGGTEMTFEAPEGVSGHREIVKTASPVKFHPTDDDVLIILMDPDSDYDLTHDRIQYDEEGMASIPVDLLYDPTNGTDSPGDIIWSMNRGHF